MPRPRPTPLYRFEPLDHIIGIADYGAIRCDDGAREAGCVVQNIGYSDLKDKRRTKPVTCGPGGVLSQYVPFYFARRSPMMAALANGRVPGYSGGQDRLVYFVTSVEAVEEMGLPWVFSDRHVINQLMDFYDDLGSLEDAVDWEAMGLRDWSPYDIKERRQAEFDVFEEVPLEAIDFCVTRNGRIQREVAQAFDQAGWEIQIEVHHDDKWYFSGYP